MFIQALKRNHEAIEWIETTSHTFCHSAELVYLGLEAQGRAAGLWGHRCHQVSHTLETVVGVARSFEACIYLSELPKAVADLRSDYTKATNWTQLFIRLTGISYATCLLTGWAFDIGSWGLSTPLNATAAQIRSFCDTGRKISYVSYLACVGTDAVLNLQEKEHYSFTMAGYYSDLISHVIEFGWVPLPCGGDAWIAQSVGVVAHLLMLQALWVEGKEKKHQP